MIIGISYDKSVSNQITIIVETEVLKTGYPTGIHASYEDKINDYLNNFYKKDFQILTINPSTNLLTVRYAMDYSEFRAFLRYLNRLQENLQEGPERGLRVDSIKNNFLKGTAFLSTVDEVSSFIAQLERFGSFITKISYAFVTGEISYTGIYVEISNYKIYMPDWTTRVFIDTRY